MQPMRRWRIQGGEKQLLQENCRQKPYPHLVRMSSIDERIEKGWECVCNKSLTASMSMTKAQEYRQKQDLSKETNGQHCEVACRILSIGSGIDSSRPFLPGFRKNS